MENVSGFLKLITFVDKYNDLKNHQIFLVNKNVVDKCFLEVLLALFFFNLIR